MILSCTSDDNIELIGRWKLIETLLDPGDGSGTFQKVMSDQTIDFFLDNTVLISATKKCGINVDASGTYSKEESIIFIECPPYNFEIKFYIQGSKLILDYPATEPVLEKYIKVN